MLFVISISRSASRSSPRISSRFSGLADLDQLVGRLARAGMQVDYEIEGSPWPLPRLVDGSAFRIIQESLTNVAKHAADATTHVHVRFAPTMLELEVSDGGGRPEFPTERRRRTRFGRDARTCRRPRRLHRSRPESRRRLLRYRRATAGTGLTWRSSSSSHRYE